MRRNIIKQRKILKPRSNALATKYYSRFDGGLNLFISDTHLKNGEIPRMISVEPDEDGIVKTRRGYSRFGSGAETSITGLGGLAKDDGTRYLLKAGGTKLRVFNEGTGGWDEVSGITYTADKKTDFCQAYNKTFIQNGTEALSYFDGTNTVTQTNGQKGEFCIYFNGSLVTNDPLNPSRVYLSGSGADTGDFSSGAGGEFIDINASDGDKITGFGKYATGSDNVILVYKQRSTYKVSFDESGLPVVAVVSPSRGCECHWTIDNMKDDIIFLSNLPALMTQGAQENFFAQIRTNELSLFVNPELEQMNTSLIKDTVGIFVKHRYFFSYAGGGQEANNKILVYDTRYQSWWYWEGIHANCFMEWEDNDGVNHFLFGSSDGNVYEFDLSTNDDGTAIHSEFDTKAFDFEEFDRIKYFPFVSFLFKNIIKNVKVRVIVDNSVIKTISIGTLNSLAGFGASLIGAFTFGSDTVDESAGYTNVAVPKRVMLRKKGRTIKLRFESSQLNSAFSLLDTSFAYKKKSRKRFDRNNIYR